MNADRPSQHTLFRTSSPSRRQFVRAGAGIAAMVAAGVAPRVLHAEDKADAKARVYGKGEHTYEVIDNWAKRPEDKAWGHTHMIQEVADGRIFVCHTGPQSMHVYDPDGKFMEAWGEEYAGVAHGLDLRKEGNEEFFYLSPTKQHRILKINLKGEKVWEQPYPKDAKNSKGEPCYMGPEKYVPTFIAFAPTGGDFYVADGYGSNYIHCYSGAGDYKFTWGGEGTREGQFRTPHGIWCDTRDPSNPMILVTDRANERLQWFTLDGKFVTMIMERLRFPAQTHQRGTDLLVADLEGCVSIYDKDNKFVMQLGDNPKPEQRKNSKVPKEALTPGDFCNPHGAIWDKAGNMFVGEWLPYGRLTKLRKVNA
jgi:hypothetical protein